MKVSVLIPSRGERNEWLQQAIESVKSQTVKAHDLQILISPEHVGQRLNEALLRSTCDAYVVLCDDDKLQPEFIETTSYEMQQSGVDIVFTDCKMFGLANHRGKPPGMWTRDAIERNTVPLVTSLCRRSAWETAGGYGQVPMYDWDFWWKCFYTGASAKYLPKPLWWYRLHDTQASKHEDLAACRRATLDRHDAIREAVMAGTFPSEIQ